MPKLRKIKHLEYSIIEKILIKQTVQEFHSRPTFLKRDLNPTLRSGDFSFYLRFYAIAGWIAVALTFFFLRERAAGRESVLEEDERESASP
ncbi:hypothetical protein A0128_04715 [Leptospira tipperaryensis]|uniref:Uncharacterized protein n=1 Tax=Leptospira tipperaryensis TaxID=2564040 RepID=A0A1D7UUD9_9LEPT|nr:hypothetical protein A0128_04715 [Leptospira tipperaryensis]